MEWKKIKNTFGRHEKGGKNRRKKKGRRENRMRVGKGIEKMRRMMEKTEQGEKWSRKKIKGIEGKSKAKKLEKGRTETGELGKGDRKGKRK